MTEGNKIVQLNKGLHCAETSIVGCEWRWRMAVAPGGVRWLRDRRCLRSPAKTNAFIAEVERSSGFDARNTKSLRSDLSLSDHGRAFPYLLAKTGILHQRQVA